MVPRQQREELGVERIVERVQLGVRMENIWFRC